MDKKLIDKEEDVPTKSYDLPVAYIYKQKAEIANTIEQLKKQKEQEDATLNSYKEKCKKLEDEIHNLTDECNKYEKMCQNLNNSIAFIQKDKDQAGGEELNDKRMEEMTNNFKIRFETLFKPLFQRLEQDKLTIRLKMEENDMDIQISYSKDPNIKNSIETIGDLKKRIASMLGQDKNQIVLKVSLFFSIKIRINSDPFL